MEQKQLELMVKPFELPDVIEANFDELKAAVQEKADEYAMALYGEDELKIAKEDKATLNRFKKALNDERIRLEKEYMRPFTDFKGKVNEIIAIVDRPIAAIDTQIKEYDARRKEEKEAEINQLLKSYVLPYGIDLTLIWNERWLNATFTMSQVKKEISERVQAITEDIKVLEDLEEDQDTAILRYKMDLDLRAVLAEVAAARQRREELKRIEEERKAAKEVPAPEKKPEAKPEVKTPEPEAKKEETQPEEGQWVSFSAYLTVDTAKMLKTFFNQHNIEFKRI